MSKEALRTQLDALQVDYQRLEAENLKLRDNRPNVAAGIEAKTEIARLNENIKQLQSENADLNSTAEAVELRLKELARISRSESLYVC